MLLSAAQAWVWTCAGGKTWTGPRDLKWAFPQLDQNTQVRSVCVCVQDREVSNRAHFPIQCKNLLLILI